MHEPQEMQVWSLGQEDPLEEEMATYSNIIVWEIPWIEDPGRLQSMGWQRETQLSMCAVPLHNLELYLNRHCTSESMGLRLDYVCRGTCNLYLEQWKKVKVKFLSRVRLFGTPWTVAYQGPPSMGFSRQEYWSGVPLPSPGDLPDPDRGIRPAPPALAGGRFTIWATREALLVTWELVISNLSTKLTLESVSTSLSLVLVTLISLTH